MTAQFPVRKFVSLVIAIFLLSQVGIGFAATPKPADNSGNRSKSEKRAIKLDLNTATESQLQELPGIGEVYSKKIVVGRPYATVQDLAKTGIPKATIAKIAPLVTVKAVAVSPRKRATMKVPLPATTGGTEVKTSPSVESPAPTAKTGKAAKEAVSTMPPQKGMVWVNTDSKIYHKEDSRWYGKTKQGKWMTEDDAIKEGNRASKE
jgi:hypothetical protein